MRFSFVFLSIFNGVIGQQDISCAQCIEFLTESGKNFDSDVGKFCPDGDWVAIIENAPVEAPTKF